MQKLAMKPEAVPCGLIFAIDQYIGFECCLHAVVVPCKHNCYCPLVIHIFCDIIYHKADAEVDNGSIEKCYITCQPSSHSFRILVKHI